MPSVLRYRDPVLPRARQGPPRWVLMGAAFGLGCTPNLRTASAPADHEYRSGRFATPVEVFADRSDDPNTVRALELTHRVLDGDLSLTEPARAALVGAWQREPDVIAPVLGRYLNLYATTLELDHVGLQVTVYEGYRDRLEAAPSSLRFAANGHHASARALQALGEDHPGLALARVHQLERRMARHLRRHPGDIDAAAMAGNFEVNFAGALPWGKRARAKRGAAYLETVYRQFGALSPGSRDLAVAPGVRVVFAFYLAECQLALGDTQRAAEIYEELDELDGPRTGPRKDLERVAAHRLEHLDDYAGRLELLPPWPSGVSSCVACHAEQGGLIARDLYVAPRLSHPLSEN